MLAEEIARQVDVPAGAEAAAVTDRSAPWQRSLLHCSGARGKPFLRSAQLVQLWSNGARLHLRLAAAPGSVVSSARCWFGM